MTDEAALLAHLGEHPDDDTARLVLADHYDETGRPQEACELRLAAQMNVIRAEPHDDAPRLRYAGVCDDYGRTERAEFVRAGIRKHLRDPGYVYRYRDYGGLDDPDVLVMFNTIDKAVWSGLRDIFGDDYFRAAAEWVGMTRGFVSAVTCSGRDWERHGDAVCAAQPVRAVRFTDAGPRVATRDSNGVVDRYWVALQIVSVSGRDLALAGSEENVRRLILSARWPQVPPEGWAFAERLIEAGWGEVPTGRTPVDDLRSLRDRLAGLSEGPPPVSVGDFAATVGEARAFRFDFANELAPGELITRAVVAAAAGLATGRPGVVAGGRAVDVGLVVRAEGSHAISCDATTSGRRVLRVVGRLIATGEGPTARLEEQIARLERQLTEFRRHAGPTGTDGDRQLADTIAALRDERDRFWRSLYSAHTELVPVPNAFRD